MSKGISTVELPQQRLEEISPDKVFQERSEVVQEIISRTPDFYEKWALLIFLSLLFLLLGSTWFIKYPDIIEADAVLTGQNAPKEIVPRQTGKLIALFAENGQQVRQGEILGWIESNADTKEIIDLSTRLDSSEKMQGVGRPGSIAALFNKKFMGLGELQTGYQTFIVALQQYNDYLVNGFYTNKKILLYNDIASLQNMEERLVQQKEFTKQENELAKTTFEMNKSLYDEKVISAEEYRRAQSVLLNKQQADPQMEIILMRQRNQIRDKQKEINQLNHDILQQQQTFEQALQTLKSSVAEWLRRYTIQAPVDGAIVLALPLQQDQYVEQGKLLGYVNPPDSRYYIEVRLSQTHFGKVDTGMKVQLRFNAYPYQETGFVSGTLSYISNMSVDSMFLGAVRLDNGLLTNQNRTIQYRNGLQAKALIITKDMRLLQRLYYSIVKAASIR